MSALHDTVTAALRTSDRLGTQMRHLLDQYPGAAGLGLFVKLLESDEPSIAYTDGVRLTAGAKFWDLPGPQQRFALMHELMHVGLAHPLRGKRMQAHQHDYDHHLWNVATDAVINYAVGSMGMLTAPEQIISIEKLERDHNVQLIGRSAEEIYAILKAALPRCEICGRRHAHTPTGERGCSDDPGCGAFAGDLHLPEHAFDPSTDNESIARWNDRMTSAAGSLGKAAERLRGDLPTVVTPWEAILRSFLRRHCGQKMRRDYRRPHQRWLADAPTARALGYLSPIIYPNRPRGAGRLAVAVDTSGSIDERLLGRFTAEIIALMRATGVLVRLIVADAAVQQVEDLDGKAGIERLKRFTYAGGGGTDFAPAITAAAEFTPDAMVYLTDFYGSTGPEPSFPMLWAVCPGGSTDDPPFGRRVTLLD